MQVSNINLKFGWLLLSFPPQVLGGLASFHRHSPREFRVEWLQFIDSFFSSVCEL